jgi:hypothetical protein
MAVILHRETFESALVQMPDSNSPVRNVVPLRVSKADPAHELRQIAILSRPQQQMPVIAHDAVATDTH